MPGVPTGLTISEETDEGFTAAWTAASSGDTPTGYTLRYTLGDVTEYVSTTETMFTLRFLQQCRTYSVAVRAISGNGESAFTSNVDATTTSSLTPQAAAQPTAVASFGVGPSALSVVVRPSTAGRNVCGVYTYSYVIKDNTGMAIGSAATKSELYHHFTGMTADAMYTVEVQELLDGANPSTARTLDVRTPMAVGNSLVPPAGLSATPTADSIVFTWTAATPQPTKYAVSYILFESGDALGPLETADGTATTETATSLTACKLYAASAGSQDDAASPVTTYGAPLTALTTVPPAQTPTVAVIAADTTFVGVRVTPSETGRSGCTEYTYTYTLKQGTNTIGMAVTKKEPTYYAMGLMPNTGYTVEVVENTIPATTASAIASVPAMTPENLLAVPQTPTIVNRAGTSIAIMWPASMDTGVTGYHVRQKIGTESETIETSATNTYTLNTGLTPCTSVEFSVRAFTDLRMSAFSPKLTTSTTAGIPSAPSSVTADAIDGNQVRLTIIDSSAATRPSCGTYEYKVTVTEGMTPVTTVQTASLTPIIGGLTKTTTYNFAVVTVETNANVDSTTSVTTTATTTNADPALGAPGEITTSQVTGTGLTATWTAPSTGTVSAYELQYSTGSGTPVTMSLGNVLSHTLTGLTPCTTYSLMVRAIDNSMPPISGAYSPTKTQMTTAGIPEPVTMVAAASFDSTQITVTITDSVMRPTCATYSYRITVTPTSGATTPVATVTSTALVNTFTENLTAGTEYRVAVKVIEVGGTSESTEMTATVTTNAQAAPRPEAPTELTLVSKTSNSIDLSWTAATFTGTITGYDVDYSTASLSSTHSTTGTGVMTTVSNLMQCTEYRFTVRAKAGNILGPKSDVLTVNTDPNTPAAVDSVTLAAASSGTAVTVTIVDTTMKPCGAFQYYLDVFRRGLTIMRVNQVKTTETTVTVDNLVAGDTYFATVRVKYENTDVFGATATSTDLALVGSNPAPGKPGTPTSSAKTTTSVTLAWTAPSTGEIKAYTLFATSNPVTLTRTSTGTDVTHEFTGLLPCTTYMFRVQAVSTQDVVGPLSDPLTVATDNAEVTAPTSAAALPLTSTSIRVFIVDTARPCTGNYVVEVFPSSSTTTAVATANPTEKTVDVMGLTAATEYVAMVAWTDGTTTSTKVSTNTVTTPESGNAPEPETAPATVITPVTAPNGEQLIFTPGLRMRGSPQFNQMQTRVCGIMSSFLGNSGTGLFANKCSVNSFTEGSVIANATVDVQSVDPGVQPSSLSQQRFTEAIKTGIMNTPPSQLAALGAGIDTESITVDGLGDGSGTVSGARLSTAICQLNTLLLAIIALLIQN